MLLNLRLGGLVYASCLLLTVGPGAASDSVTYPCAGTTINSGLRLDGASIDDLNALQASGSVRSVDLVHAYIQRISEVNPLLHAVSEINPDAFLIAQDLDNERAAGRVRGPLHGIPILIKDNIATLDRMNNTAGSFALLGAVVSRESTVVTKLREAGAVVLGKATMGEWAQWRSRRASSSHGWSAYGGQCLGAYYPRQDPSGNSSGSAVAASVGLALGALATETSGSIVLPAEKSNIVGIKPTLGLTSRSMVIPISLRQDSIGPVAQSVKDAAILLSAIAGKDTNDNWTSAQPFDQVPDYVKACNYSAFKGARLGIPRNGIDYFLDNNTKPIMTAFEAALDLIRGSGAKVVDKADFALFDVPAFSRNSNIVLGTDFIAGISAYLKTLKTNPNNVRNMGDIKKFTKDDAREEYPDRDTYVWDSEFDRNITDESKESYDAYQANLHMAEEQGIVGALDRYGLDALVMPTFASFHLPSIAGLPIVTVPLGFYPPDTAVAMNLKGTLIDIAPNVPFGIAFIGRQWSEETLISLAYAFEQRTMIRKKRKPYINPTFELGDSQTPLPSTKSNQTLITLEATQNIVKRDLSKLFSTRSWSWSLFARTDSSM